MVPGRAPIPSTEGIGDGGHPSGNAIEADGNDYPTIVYRKADMGFEDLRIARPRGSVPWIGAGNCGRLSIAYSWSCETLDAGNSGCTEAIGGSEQT